MFENSTAHVMIKIAYMQSVAQDGRNECANVYIGDLYNVSGALDVCSTISEVKQETSYSRIGAIHPAFSVTTDSPRIATIRGIMKLDKINIFPILSTPNNKTRSSCTTKAYRPNANMKEFSPT